MSKRRKVGAAVAVAAVAAAGVAVWTAGNFGVAGGESFADAFGGAPASSSGAPTTAPEAAVPTGNPSVAPETGVTEGADPQSGQTVATDTRPVATGSAVRVVATFHDWNATTHQVMVGGYVQGVIEDGGTCTLTLTSGSSTAVGHTQAHADASTTTCGAVTVEGGPLAAGTWQAVLSYRSPKYSGTAAPVSVEVPQ